MNTPHNTGGSVLRLVTAEGQVTEPQAIADGFEDPGEKHRSAAVDNASGS